MRRDAFVLALGAVALDVSVGWAGEQRRERGQTGVPDVVRRYIAAWREGRASRLPELFTADGTYVDDVGIPISGQALIDYASAFEKSRFRLVEVVTAADKCVVHWRVSSGRCARSIAVRDELVLSSDGKRIESASSFGYTPSGEIVALMGEYTAGWNTYDGERSAATFAANGMYYDPDHPNGVTPAELVAVVEALTWAVLTGFFGLVMLKDGRLFGRWDMYLAESGQLILQGYDLITLHDDKILKVQGHW